MQILFIHIVILTNLSHCYTKVCMRNKYKIFNGIDAAENLILCRAQLAATIAHKPSRCKREVFLFLIYSLCVQCVFCYAIMKLAKTKKTLSLAIL